MWGLAPRNLEINSHLHNSNNSRSSSSRDRCPLLRHYPPSPLKLEMTGAENMEAEEMVVVLKETS